MVGWWPSAGGSPEDDDRERLLAAARRAVDDLAATGIARGVAARRVAAETGLPRRALYAKR